MRAGFFKAEASPSTRTVWATCSKRGPPERTRDQMQGQAGTGGKRQSAAKLGRSENRNAVDLRLSSTRALTPCSSPQTLDAIQRPTKRFLFHGDAGKADREGTVAKTEAERTPLAAAFPTAFVPVTHTLRIVIE
jgi:hypothetical protein